MPKRKSQNKSVKKAKARNSANKSKSTLAPVSDNNIDKKVANRIYKKEIASSLIKNVDGEFDAVCEDSEYLEDSMFCAVDPDSYPDPDDYAVDDDDDD